MGFFARICPEKGLHVLAEAFRLALSYPTTAVGRELAQATLGMIGGQYLDITGTASDLAQKCAHFELDVTTTSQEITNTGEKIRTEIIDQGVGFTPVERDGDLSRAGGWGLHLVEELTDRWGTYEGSTHVWFEIDPSAPRPYEQDVAA